jgi:hypothetical protein
MKQREQRLAVEAEADSRRWSLKTARQQVRNKDHLLSLVALKATVSIRQGTSTDSVELIVVIIKLMVVMLSNKLWK